MTRHTICPASPSSFHSLYLNCFECECLCVCRYTYVHLEVKFKDRFPDAKHLSFWNTVSNWHGTLSRWVCLMNLSVPASPVLGLQEHDTTPPTPLCFTWILGIKPRSSCSQACYLHFTTPFLMKTSNNRSTRAPRMCESLISDVF